MVKNGDYVSGQYNDDKIDYPQKLELVISYLRVLGTLYFKFPQLLYAGVIMLALLLVIMVRII